MISNKMEDAIAPRKKDIDGIKSEVTQTVLTYLHSVLLHYYVIELY